VSSSLDRAAIDWLLSSTEPGVRFLTRRDLVGESPSSPAMAALSKRIHRGPKASALLAFENVDFYTRWRGAHWRLISLVELGLPATNKPAQATCSDVVDIWVRRLQRFPARVVNGRVRRHASMEGHALVVASSLGMAKDERVALLAESLLAWQWPDGGWNCDSKATHRSSFHESLVPTWGLLEYYRQTKEPRCLEAVTRAAELFLEHHLWRTTKTMQPIHRDFGQLHWPAYWRYDFLQAMRVLEPLGVLSDPRCDDAFELLVSKRKADGRWGADKHWWFPPGSKARARFEAVDWEIVSDQMITLNALRADRARRRKKGALARGR